MIRSAVFSVACSLLLAAAASAQQPGRPQADSTKGMHGPQMNRQRQMNRQMMMQKIQESDARLDRLVSQMNQSSGNKKVQAMAAVINELVAQRKQMHQRMGQMMDSGMMDGGGGRRGMMQNMQPAGPDTAPMGPPAADSGNHAEHHDTLK
jgi:hypothetical protein